MELKYLKTITILSNRLDRLDYWLGEIRTAPDLVIYKIHEILGLENIIELDTAESFRGYLVDEKHRCLNKLREYGVDV